MKSNRIVLIVILFICFFNNEFTLGFIDKAIDISVFTNMIVILSLFVVAFNFQIILKRFKLWLVILVIILSSLVIQSETEYHVLFVYPHVFYELLVPFVLFATYSLARKIEASYLDLFSKTIIFFYLFDLFILGWIKYYSPLKLFDVDPNIGGAGDSRVFHAQIVYLFILPFLYYYARYLEERKSKFLALSGIIGIILLFQNHRSIWVSGAIALLSLTYLYKKSVSTSRFFNGEIIISIAAISSIIFGVIFFRDTSIFEERFGDIINWQTQGTGQWRYEQIETYLPFIYRNIIWGLRLNGFRLSYELAIFGGFEAGTGMHFHNGFIDIIYYHGIIGLFLTYGLVFLIIYQLYKRKNKNLRDITGFSFLLGAIPFSFAYQLPLAFWGIAGIIATFAFSGNALSRSNKKHQGFVGENGIHKNN